jgi:hypothetical protein
MRRRLSESGQRAVVSRDGLEEEEGFMDGGKGYLIAAARAKMCARHSGRGNGLAHLLEESQRQGTC